MKYNEEASECQIYLGVDCTAYTYETLPSKIILESIENKPATNTSSEGIPNNEEVNSPLSKHIQNLNSIENKTTKNTPSEGIPNNEVVNIPISKRIQNLNLLDLLSTTESTMRVVDEIYPDSDNDQATNLTNPKLKYPTIEDSLSTSLLNKLDTDKATANDLTEAFCRDVDSFSFDMNVYVGKPSNCGDIPQTACGVAYDSSSCGGGWAIILREGEISFPYFSSYWKYRNDIDLIGVKAGCSLTAFADSGFSGPRATFTTGSSDQWFVLSEHEDFKHLDENIESMYCVCQDDFI